MEGFHSRLPIFGVLLLVLLREAGSRLVFSDDNPGQGGRNGEQAFKFQSPDLTEEEQWSNHMPVHMECDGCKLIARLFHLEFEKAAMRSEVPNVLLESEVIEVVETVCENKFADYGAKEVNGVLRLSGPHTEVFNMPGVMSGGGQWPNRLRQLCSRYWDELGDEGIYAAWQDDDIKLSDYLCYAPERPRNACYTMQMNQQHVPPKERDVFERKMAMNEEERKERLEKRSEKTKKLRLEGQEEL